MARTVTVSDDVVIAASPLHLYELISVPAQMRRWSPENTGADVTVSAQAGTTFVGSNTRGGLSWVTRAVVTAAEPGKRFAFTVTAIGRSRPVLRGSDASWEYRFTPVDGGTLVTETWHDDRPWPDAAAAVFDLIVTGTTFADFQRRNIRRTLDRLKADVESA